MKTIFASTAVALVALTGAANAMTSVPEGQLAQIKTYAPGADVSDISYAEAQTLLSIIHSGDSESEKRTEVKQILR